MNINLKNNYDILLINLVYLKSNGKKNVRVVPIRFRSVYLQIC